jgi:hypothetical protein
MESTPCRHGSPQLRRAVPIPSQHPVLPPTMQIPTASFRPWPLRSRLRRARVRTLHDHDVRFVMLYAMHSTLLGLRHLCLHRVEGAAPQSPHLPFRAQHATECRGILPEH